MTAIDTAIEKVKELSPGGVRELLVWLDMRDAVGQGSRRKTRKPAAKRIKSKEALKKWQNSIRFTTNWEPPRMPDDVIKRITL